MTYETEVTVTVYDVNDDGSLYPVTIGAFVVRRTVWDLRKHTKKSRKNRRKRNGR